MVTVHQIPMLFPQLQSFSGSIPSDVTFSGQRGDFIPRECPISNEVGYQTFEVFTKFTCIVHEDV